MTAEFGKDVDRDLEACFQALQDETETASPDLLARVLADAYETQDGMAAVAAETLAPEPRVRRGRIVGRLFEAIGGWPAVAGLASAVGVGVWIGYNPPAALDTVAWNLMDSSYSVSLGASFMEYDTLSIDG